MPRDLAKYLGCQLTRLLDGFGGATQQRHTLNERQQRFRSGHGLTLYGKDPVTSTLPIDVYSRSMGVRRWHTSLTAEALANDAYQFCSQSQDRELVASTKWVTIIR